ncbi:glycosyltransferase family 2 protein [Acaryochloris marina]|uniref:Glycosyl transferase, group 2 family protein n=1 Tax=Acaryochloris marina (strain MBIC 11017) TaxID=329726 RepID=B0C8P8_ACAM1|nr:glycosyltransferase [Acaryochloris marina]ABW31310.1 glycosyl transferase, group 2 family protein [Acaryochloris marina MBIC11017]BDM79987.1 glycosyl transferase [Acaryochloris marina MBIC10699]
MSNPKVTIIVVPRERFQFARESLESLFENTFVPFKLIYVDNNSPRKLRQNLEFQSLLRRFQVVRSETYLSPNQARNLGLQYVTTPYVVFVDNDVVFTSGWLEKLVNCTEETGATVVGSLVCQYRPVHTIVHCAGGTYMAPAAYSAFARGELNPSGTLDYTGGWKIQERTPYQNQPLAEVCDQLYRQPTGFVEFHAMLVRTAIFDRIGPLDEGFSCTKEYLDFCMMVTRAGGLIYLEPDSVVTFLTHPPAPALQWSDIPYFMLRWSDAWELSNLLHYQQKWGLQESRYFQKRYQKLGQRRRKVLIRPIAKKFAFLGKHVTRWIEQQLFNLEKRFNRWFSKRHANRLANAQRISGLRHPNNDIPKLLPQTGSNAEIRQQSLSDESGKHSLMQH